MPSSTEERNDATAPQLDIPPGYSVLQMSDGHNYLVPNFLINDTDLTVETQAMKRLMKVQQAPGGVSVILCMDTFFGADTFIGAKVVPVPSLK